MRDEIDDLVDAQLAARPGREVVQHTCKECKCHWVGGPMICPKCGERQ